MRERKKTGLHGTLEMIPLAWKLNSKQLLCKTLNSRMNIIETRAVLIIVQKDLQNLNATVLKRHVYQTSLQNKPVWIY